MLHVMHVCKARLYLIEIPSSINLQKKDLNPIIETFLLTILYTIKQTKKKRDYSTSVLTLDWIGHGV